MEVPKPNATWGRWRSGIVRQHGQRGKASDRNAELESQLRAWKDTDNDQTEL